MNTSSEKTSARAEKGNIFFYILIAIAAVALMTYFVSQSTQQQSDTMTIPEMDNQIAKLTAQAGTIGGAINQMVVNGADAATLYTNLSTLKPGDAGFETAPHQYKIYHPMGGGVSYMDATGAAASSSTIATGFQVVPAAIIAGVGPTDAVVGDVVFVATVTSQAACARINTKLIGTSTIPALQTAVFNTLFGGAAATVDNASCAGCVSVPRQCVSNGGNTAWGFYAALLPG